MAKIDLRNVRPKVERLPDGRARATFSYQVREWVGRTKAEILAECFLAWGTEAPGDFTGLRLIKQDLEGLTPNDNGSLPLVRVFEELPETAEIQVGENEVRYETDGSRVVVAKFLQFTAGALVPGTIGTTTAPGDSSVWLQKVEAPDDGTLRTITRTYTDGGTISESETTRNNGKLTLRTIVASKTAPATPSGFTLIDAKTDSPDGFPVYTYTFAKGTGTINTSDESKNNGKLLLRTITALGTAPSTPSGYTVTSTQTREDDGFIFYSYTFAKGAGRVSTSTDVKYGGVLTVTTIRFLGTDDGSTPAGTLLTSDVQQQDGYTLTTSVYADGHGVIATSTSTEYDGKLTRTTKVTLNEVPDMGAMAVIDAKVDVRDDAKIYTYTGVSGTGVIATSTATNGPLTTTTISFLNGEPTIPADSVITDVRLEAHAGYFVKTVSFASGAGELSRSESEEYGGLLVRVTVAALNEEPDIEGNVIATKVDIQNGQTIITKTAVVVTPGVVATSTATNGPLTTTTVSYLNGDPEMPADVVLLAARTDLHEGYFITTVTYAGGAGELSRSESSEYGGQLTRITVVSLNEEPDIGGNVIETKVEIQNGQRIISKTSVAGSGVIATSTATNGPLVTTTISYLNGEPESPADSVITDVRLEAHAGFFIKTVTFASGSGELSRGVAVMLNSLVTTTTVVSLNEEPDVSGTVVATKVELQNGQRIFTKTVVEATQGQVDVATSTQETLGGSITKKTYIFVLAAGELGENELITDTKTETRDGYYLTIITTISGTGLISESTRSEYGGALVFTTKVCLNIEPTGTGDIIDTKVEIHDSLVLYTKTFVVASTVLLDEIPDERADGSVITTYISYGEFYDDGDGDKIESDILPQNGYQLYKTVFYKKPDDYELPVNLTVLKPGVMDWDADNGPVPSREPEIVNIAATAEVSFLTSAPGSIPVIVPINARCTVYEHAVYDDGKSPEVLNHQATFRDYYSGGISLISTNDDYRGRHAASYAVNSTGTEDQAGADLVFSSTVEPYFRAGGLTIFKQTVVTGTL